MLEFAEAQVMTDDPVIASRLRDLKSLGVILAIDGFGNGFSSVRHLGRYPVDVIKIARPVVATMSRTAEDARIGRGAGPPAPSAKGVGEGGGGPRRSRAPATRTTACGAGSWLFPPGALEAQGPPRCFQPAPGRRPPPLGLPRWARRQSSATTMMRSSGANVIAFDFAGLTTTP